MTGSLCQLFTIDLDSGYVEDLVYINPLTNPENAFSLEKDNISHKLFAIHWSLSFEKVGLIERTGPLGNSWFPNPAKGIITLLNGEEITENSSIILRDAVGRICLRQDFERGQKIEIARPEISPGIYLCELKTGAQTPTFTRIVFE
jgi:hypothetical protein